jgi:hypothetical protein
LQHFLTFMPQDSAKNYAHELKDAWAGRVEKAGNDNRADQFEQPDRNALA